ncbi:adhesion G-protein coupled receptor F3-like [Protopterus annectens]|uniref:adhesion G-protein coupled receptor F3-like n=1 Tax=Protopterus annectens TaxID=7888 RepID=UPI001CFB75E8|nr:adhesion G-protein coupled receptor F3-like [Protopterus annectens]
MAVAEVASQPNDGHTNQNASSYVRRRRQIWFVNITTFSARMPYQSKFTILCHLNSILPTSTVTWFVQKPFSNITEGIFRGVISDITTTTDASSTTSNLTVKSATALWRGTYTCNFINGSVTHMVSTSVDIDLLPEVITTSLLQINIIDNAGKPNSISCCVNADGENYTIAWTRQPGAKQLSAPPPQASGGQNCTTLLITSDNPNDGDSYVCTYANKINQNVSGFINVSVVKKTDKTCPEDIVANVTWLITKLGSNSVMTCPPGRVGNRTRQCLNNGSWDTVLDNCVNEALNKILDLAQSVTPRETMKYKVGKRTLISLDKKTSNHHFQSNLSAVIDLI